MQAETFYVEANGLRFETDRLGTGKKLALLLHGFPESKFSWRFQLPLFAELGYTAWAPNLRGYGESSRPEGIGNYKLGHLLDDVAGLIDAAKAEGIDGPVTLVAHDWGGVIAWAFALKQVRPLERFIVMNLPHPAKFNAGIGNLAQLKRSWYAFFFQVPVLPERMMTRNDAQGVRDAFYNMAVSKERFPKDVLDHYAENALKPGAMTAMINYYRGLFRSSEIMNEARQVVPLKTPTLMIWGEEDIALGKELTYGTGELVEDFTLRYLPDVSHWVQQEAPETVNAMIRAWIEGAPVPYAGPKGALLTETPDGH